MVDQTLVLMAKEIRGKTLRILDGVSDADARWAPPGLNNSIIWHAGHSMVVVEHLSVAAASGKEPQLPAGWFDLFSWKSKPGPGTQYPPLVEVAGVLRDQLERLVPAIGQVSSDRMEAIVNPTRNWTLRYSILHGLHDEAGHQGEMWLLKKLIGKRASL
jgi:DinB superfamily